MEVTRPDIAGLMGAYGAALYARDRHRRTGGHSTVLDAEALTRFRHEVRTAACGKCPNHCGLTINRFGEGRQYISGNRCERPVTRKEPDARLNGYHEKRMLLQEYRPVPGRRGKIGLPLGLNFYELLPFWHTLLTELGFEVVLSPHSSRGLYLRGQGSIPSDTVCFPAKLMHGHVQSLVDQGVKTLFYPCMTYNMDDGQSDNCFNCPIVAYYPEVLAANVPELRGVNFLHGYLGVHHPRYLPRKLWQMLLPAAPGLTLRETRAAVKAAYRAYGAHMERVREKGEEILRLARAEKRPVVVLAGRPYHIDPEINHGIDQLIAGMGIAVVSEDMVSHRMEGELDLRVLNQWTYHSRLYAAARYAGTQKDMQFVQLVSFGCGCDAITSDECRRITEEAGKIYTQIKIDEIENLGAAKIRLRSLFAATGIA